MRNLALGSLLFCGLAAVLGYVATSGVGMRTTGFAQTVVENIPLPPKKTVTPAPEVEIKATPLKVAPPIAVVSKPVLPKPMAVHSPAIHRLAADSRFRRTKSTVRPPSIKGAVAITPAITAVAKRPSKTPTPAGPVRRQSLAVSVDSQLSQPHDESQDLQREKDAEQRWREQTLSRWRGEKQQRAQSSRGNREGGSDSTLDRTPVGGLYSPDEEKKPKKKRHRFLFIRW